MSAIYWDEGGIRLKLNDDVARISVCDDEDGTVSGVDYVGAEDADTLDRLVIALMRLAHDLRGKG